MSSPYRINATPPFGERERDVARFARGVRAARQRGLLLALGLVVMMVLFALAPLAGCPLVGRVGPEDVGERSGIAWAGSPARLPVGFRLERPWIPCVPDEACDF
ncbi:MAG TPA: hypothetical protein VLM85_15410 [Polyangiaceae bacterium]|nr:hypothetical protein [Polyangiaceae bacterium]